MNIRLLLESPGVVAVEKPVNMLSVPARFEDDPRPVLGRVLEEQLGRRIWPVHRLDFEVSGVMIFALTSEAHRVLNAAFEKQQIQKTYQAFSADRIDFAVGAEARWESHLLRGKKRSYESPHGQLARTDVKLVNRTDVVDATGERQTTLEWRMWPRTGKPHQLRFELYKHQAPILGDLLYGSEWSFDGIALRAIELQLPAELATVLAVPNRVTVGGLAVPKQLVKP